MRLAYFGATAAELGSALAALDQQMIAALMAQTAAAGALAAANARVSAAKAAYSMLNKMDADWFEAIDTKSHLTPEEGAYFNKYRYTFHMKGNGTPDYEAGSDALYADTQKAFREMLDAEDALPAVKQQKSDADAAVSAAQAALKKANAAHTAQVKLEQQQAVAVAEAKARAADPVYQQLMATQAKKSATTKKLLIGAAIIVPLLGLIGFALTRKKPSVAGYRRRSRR